MCHPPSVLLRIGSSELLRNKIFWPQSLQRPSRWFVAWLLTRNQTKQPFWNMPNGLADPKATAWERLRKLKTCRWGQPLLVVHVLIHIKPEGAKQDVQVEAQAAQAA